MILLFGYLFLSFFWISTQSLRTDDIFWERYRRGSLGGQLKKRNEFYCAANVARSGRSLSPELVEESIKHSFKPIWE